VKTIISIPDHPFEEADRFAAQRGVSRSEPYAEAVAEYLKSQNVMGVRERLDAVYSADRESSALEPEVLELQSKSVAQRKW
jgi:metal-responsive CopG/Arc/MetJ family transcriptional regulator